MTLVTRMFALLAVAAWVPVVAGLIGRLGPLRAGDDDEAGGASVPTPLDGSPPGPQDDDFLIKHQEPMIGDPAYVAFEDEPETSARPPHVSAEVTAEPLSGGSLQDTPPPAGPDATDRGQFGRFFPHLKPATFGATAADEAANLRKLADAMIAPPQTTMDGPDAEESGIPAAYTYFGQLIEHDLTFEPAASDQSRKGHRSPAFDLDSIYGRGPAAQPYLYEEDGKSFVFGAILSGGKPPGAHDLPRNKAGRAVIADRRNDGNVILSQLQDLIYRFHNRMVAENPALDFSQVQERVRHHYQYVILNDFLPRIVSAAVLNELKTGGAFDRARLKLFQGFDRPFIPAEFAAAAFLFGHSMIRPGYRLNDRVMLPLFSVGGSGTDGTASSIAGPGRRESNWALDWGRFIDIDMRPYGAETVSPSDPAGGANLSRLQFAYRIDTALVDPLKHLPVSVAPDPSSSLALRNLLNGQAFGLPSGQAVAAALGVPPLPDAEILIGPAIDNLEVPAPNIVKAAGAAFAANCPLWTYVLAEAMQNSAVVTIPVVEAIQISTPQLGPVGGRIVAEVIVGILFADPGAYLSVDPTWTPPSGKTYGLRDLVRYACGA